MHELAKYKNYLWVVAALVLAQFVWLPQWSAKQEKWELLNSLNRTMARASQLLANKDLVLENKQELEHIVVGRRAQLQRAENINRYRLTQQSSIESLAAAQKISVTQVSWRDGLVKSSVHTQLMEIRLTGGLQNYLEFLDALQRQYPYFEITTADASLQGQDKSAAGTVSVNLALSVRVAIAPAKEAA